MEPNQEKKKQEEILRGNASAKFTRGELFQDDWAWGDEAGEISRPQSTRTLQRHLDIFRAMEYCKGFWAEALHDQLYD